MSRPVTDERSYAALHKKLVAALTQSTACGDILYSWGEHFRAFNAEAMKITGAWLGEDDLISVLIPLFRAKFSSKFENIHTEHQLSESLSVEEISFLADSVVEFLRAIPCEYDVSFPIPTFRTVTREVIISDKVKLLPRNVSIFPGSDRHEGAFISIRAKGFIFSSMQNSGMREALATLKLVLQIGNLYNIFYRGSGPKPVNSGVFALYGDTETIYSASVRAVGSDTELRIKLSSGISRYLSCITARHYDHGKFQDSLAKLAKPLNIMYQPDADENVRSIRRALEWQFDAFTDEDVTTRFIKTCIGLEALLAEQNEMGITEQLADRCAFLLSKTSVERKTRREMMRSIYKLRSKIVHGAVTGLSHKDSETNNQAANLLASLLSVELTAVERWWNLKSARALLNN